MKLSLVTLTMSVLFSLGVHAQTGGFDPAQDPATGPSIYGDVRSKGGSMRIYVSGSLKLSLVSRNDDYFAAALAGGALGANAAGPGGGTGGDVFVNPFAQNWI